MNEVEFILSLVERNPNIRGSTIRHRLEKRRKVEELKQQERRDAMVSEAMKPQPVYSWFDHLLGRWS